MASYSIYQVDAFTSHRFGGNPAAVVLLSQWLPAATMQQIAAENNLAETAFVVADGNGWSIRWFTPAVEVDLCGHATLAAAFVLNRILEHALPLRFDSASGELRVVERNNLLTLDFPAEQVAAATLPSPLSRALGVGHCEAFCGKFWLLVVDDEPAVRALSPDFAALVRADARPVMVTAAGDEVDFVSRFFAPSKGIDEDHVTGSAHCLLAPFWAERMGRSALSARQLSPRGGELTVEVAGDRVLIGGDCVPYLEGSITL